MLQARIDDRLLRLEVVRDRVLELRVPRAEVLGEDLAAAAGHPVHARVAQARRRIRVRQPCAIREEHELRDRQRIELDAIAVALAHRREQVAVVVERQLRVEPAVEPDEVAADLQQLVDLREDVVARQHVAALLVREDVERAVVALRDAHVRVVDDPHHHVGGAVGLVVARAHEPREPLQLLVRRMPPERRRLGGRDPATRLDPRRDLVQAHGVNVSMNEETEKTAFPGPDGP